METRLLSLVLSLEEVRNWREDVGVFLAALVTMTGVKNCIQLCQPGLKNLVVKQLQRASPVYWEVLL